MLIYVDVDGVVADLVTPWLAAYNQDYGDNLTPADIKGWNIDKYVKCSYAIYDYLSPALYASVEPIPGALAGVAYLRNLGHRVIFATTPTERTLGVKYHWLADMGFEPTTRDYIEVGDKSLLNPRGWLIDDGIHNLEAYQGQGVLFEQPWNIGRRLQGPRAAGWEELTRWPMWRVPRVEV